MYLFVYLSFLYIRTMRMLILIGPVLVINNFVGLCISWTISAVATLTWKVRNSLGSCGGPAISEARVKPSIKRSSTLESKACKWSARRPCSSTGRRRNRTAGP